MKQPGMEADQINFIRKKLTKTCHKDKQIRLCELCQTDMYLKLSIVNDWTLTEIGKMDLHVQPYFYLDYINVGHHLLAEIMLMNL